MRMIKLFICLATLLIFTQAVVAFGAGNTCVFTASTTQVDTLPKTLSYVCTADGSTGNISLPTISGSGADLKYKGKVTGFYVIPDQSASYQPNADFAVKFIPNVAGWSNVDLLHNLAAHCGNTLATWKDITDGFVAPLPMQAMTVSATGVGAGKKFTLFIYLDR